MQSAAAVRSSTIDTQFHILSFEGPDGYSRAGGITSRISGLSEALAEASFETHLWFVGDPELAGHENHGLLSLHRWCQWISHYHPAGVYDGEDGKRADYAASLPPFLVREVLLPHLQRGGRAVVLAEEWQTVDTVLHLDWLFRNAQVRDKVSIFWNANNVFSFDRIAWDRLAAAAVITTVSRFMKYQLWQRGVNPLVIPNGLNADAFAPPDREAVAALRSRVRNRILLSKVARWDPDKRWLLAIDTVRVLKNLGWRPLLIARGGIEEHGAEVLAKAKATGLRVVERSGFIEGGRDLLQALEGIGDADIVHLRTPLDAESCRLLFRGSDAVLANSGREPFGLVGLETMAAGGVACTGSTGEDYVIPGRSALVLETADPWELSLCFGNCAPIRCATERCVAPAARLPSNFLSRTSSSDCSCRACIRSRNNRMPRNCGQLKRQYRDRSSYMRHQGGENDEQERFGNGKSGCHQSERRRRREANSGKLSARPLGRR